MLSLRFTPVARAQIAIWLERDGAYVATVGLTEAVARYGIGNRPGASEMNSGFRWPYGRREGVLPVWAARRASQPGARSFRRVIFQQRPEGHASRSWADSSPDRYYCLQFAQGHSRKDALDAVSCASVFSSDKGRFIEEADLAAGYAEPYEAPVSLTPSMRALSLESPYPPRRDLVPCESCPDSPDTATYNDHALEVMAELDAVSMATPVGKMEQHLDYLIPNDWPGGLYRACLEINVEGDYNPAFGPDVYPTPHAPEGKWDDYAEDWGYPYRGQPSVVYCAELELGVDGEQRATASEALGTPGSWDVRDPTFGEMRPMENMTDDPVAAPGSGADRLSLMDEGVRLEAVLTPPTACEENRAPSAVTELTIAHDEDRLHAHERVRLRFHAAGDDHAVRRYDVRVATTAITDASSFMAAAPAREATTEAAALRVPTDGVQGQTIDVRVGGLVEGTHYFIAVRASDACAATGPLASAEIRTKPREFATVSPCFVATAAYGSPLASEIGALRRLRDRHLRSTGMGRWLVEQYETYGPRLADAIRDDDTRRTIARALLTPVIEAAELLGRE